MSRLSLICRLVPALLAGCAPVAPQGPVLALRLDRAVVERSDSGTAQVLLALQNVGGAAAYFVGCAQPVGVWVERFISTGWTDAYGVNTACTTQIIPARLDLAPGQHVDVRFAFDQIGRYRLRLTFGASPQQPYAYHQTTPEFEVR